ncbi:hypothetical protein EDD36DRAFT_427056 [Exophiala viscosa]|uniref:Secreted protein n=1 Tax=Exophiala viscosa TaxID=2486360 RepID=A0AAN6E749_9EURO|nr:hypothetical protein EDD36DRAFT_427056 [Exophiala viscosa]
MLFSFSAALASWISRVALIRACSSYIQLNRKARRWEFVDKVGSGANSAIVRCAKRRTGSAALISDAVQPSRSITLRRVVSKSRLIFSAQAEQSHWACFASARNSQLWNGISGSMVGEVVWEALSWMADPSYTSMLRVRVAADCYRECRVRMILTCNQCYV